MTWVNGGYKNWLSMSNSTNQFKIKFNRSSETADLSFAHVAGQAAMLLYNQWGDKPLYLAFSGGIDSEFVAQTLLDNDIPFTPVILKIGNLNEIETWYAEYWCYQNNITPVVLEYTLSQYSDALIKFFPKLASLNNYAQAPILIIYDYVNHADGYCIYAGGDINLDSSRKEFYCENLDFISDLINVGKHPTSFFMYTPELALAYIKHFDINLSEQYNKLSLYKISPRPKIDYVVALHHHPELNSIKNKLFHMFNVGNTARDTTHWYGTKEQLVHDLQP